MTLIYCRGTREGYEEVFCSNCLESIGQLTIQEIGALSVAGIAPLCFGCDGGACDKVPSQLIMEEQMYLLILGDQHFIVNLHNELAEGVKGRMYLCPISGLRYVKLSQQWREWRDTPLACSTNLHSVTEEAVLG